MPLDEYYYGKKEGDPAYREEKGEFRFKVSILYNQRHDEVIHQIASISQVYTQANGLCIVYAVTSSVAYILTACTC